MDNWDWIPFIARNWKVILLTIVVVATIALAVTLSMPPVYSSTVTLTVEPLTLDQPLSFPTALEHGAVDVAELLKSPAVVKRAARMIGGSTEDVGANITVEIQDKSSLVKLTAEAGTPSRAASAANALAESYIEENAAMLSVAAQRTQDMLKRKLTDLKKQIAFLQKELAAARTRPNRRGRVAALQDQISSTQSGYEQLLQQWQNLPTSQVTLATAVHIAQRAEPNPSPVRPRPVLGVVLGVAGGFFLGLALARGLESVRPRPETQDGETTGQETTDEEMREEEE